MCYRMNNIIDNALAIYRLQSKEYTKMVRQYAEVNYREVLLYLIKSSSSPQMILKLNIYIYIYVYRILPKNK